MKRIFLGGWGAVSPAGWGVPALRAALENGAPLPVREMAHPACDRILRVREVPPPEPRPAFFRHPRLRRTSDLTRYAAAAAWEALGPDAATRNNRRLGLIVCLQCGCVQYTCRFFDELLRDPATASPILFPETVFNAPASHLAALLGGEPALTLTLVGDPGTFLVGVAEGAEWILEGRVEECLVVGAEEAHPLLADALWHFDHGGVLAAGAGAVRLTARPDRPDAPELACVTHPFTYRKRLPRDHAALAMRSELLPARPGELLCDGLQGRPRPDAAEQTAWRHWPGPRLSPKALLGEGLMAAGAWQCVVAADALQQGRAPSAVVSLVGVNQQAIGARFVAAGA